MLGFVHGILSLLYGTTGLVFMDAPWMYDNKVYQVLLVAQLLVGGLMMVASVVIMTGQGWALYQGTFLLQAAAAAVCAVAFFPSGLVVVPFALAVPLTGALLLTRPDSKWYLGIR